MSRNNEYDPSLISYWKNGIPYSELGVQLMPTITIEVSPGMDNALNFLANHVCPVCAKENCRHDATISALKGLRSAYAAGNFMAFRRSYMTALPFINKDPLILAKIEEDRKNKEEEATLNQFKSLLGIFKEISEKFGEQAAQTSKELIKQAKGKTIRGIQDALNKIEEFQNGIQKRINSKDRAAIAKAYEAIEMEHFASTAKFIGKVLGTADRTLDAYDLFIKEFPKAWNDKNWRPFLVKSETIFAGYGAVALATYALSAVIAVPVTIPGIIAFAVFMGIISALIDDELVEKFNKLIGI